jgi:transposase-like protein
MEGGIAMGEKTTERRPTSSATWETLETWARTTIQGWFQELLEAEVSEALGRDRSVRRATVDATLGYRNGHGKPRQVAMMNGTITVRRPRVRGLTERFESRLLPLFKRRTPEVSGLLPELYLHGLAERDFDLALRGLLGDGAPLSASSIARLKTAWNAEYEAWRTESLAALEPVYLWVDGIYVKAGLEQEKAAMLVVIAGLGNGEKRVLAVESGARESTASWSKILRDLAQRGLRCPKLVVGDGHLGIWGALANVFPGAGEQRCWNHRIVNVLDKLPKKAQGQAKILLTEIAYAETREEARRLKGAFAKWCAKHGYQTAAAILAEDWDRMVTFFDFPKEHWKHVRTTNPVESPFAAVRLRTSAAKRYKKVDRATAVIWKTLLVAEKNFRSLDAPELLRDVLNGTTYVNGVKVEAKGDEDKNRKAAA